MSTEFKEFQVLKSHLIRSCVFTIYANIRLHRVIMVWQIRSLLVLAVISLFKEKSRTSFSTIQSSNYVIYKFLLLTIRIVSKAWEGAQPRV